MVLHQIDFRIGTNQIRNAELSCGTPIANGTNVTFASTKANLFIYLFEGRGGGLRSRLDCANGPRALVEVLWPVVINHSD